MPSAELAKSIPRGLPVELPYLLVNIPTHRGKTTLGIESLPESDQWRVPMFLGNKLSRSSYSSIAPARDSSRCDLVSRDAVSRSEDASDARLVEGRVCCNIAHRRKLQAQLAGKIAAYARQRIMHEEGFSLLGAVAEMHR